MLRVFLAAFEHVTWSCSFGEFQQAECSLGNRQTELLLMLFRVRLHEPRQHAVVGMQLVYST